MIALVDKYRPKKISSVIGQPIISQSFQNILADDMLHQAYLFSGHTGCGKTTTARIIAATINCLTKGKDPCGKCNNCVEILAGNDTSVDVIELDGGSNGSVDKIRAIRSTLHQSPVTCRMKVIIIDEAHFLTKEALAAFLKMIEEPPSHVIFILCTTEPQALKSTILGRCQRYTFHKVNWMVMEKYLGVIAKAEKINIDDEALQICAKNAIGSVRISLQNLQSLSTFAGDNQITAEDAMRVLEVVDDRYYFKLFDFIIKKDAYGSVRTLEEIFSNGRDAKVVLDGMFAHLNKLLTFNIFSKNNKEDDLEMDSNEIMMLKNQFNSIGSTGDILLMSDLMLHSATSIEYSLNPQMVLDNYCIKAMASISSAK